MDQYVKVHSTPNALTVKKSISIETVFVKPNLKFFIVANFSI